jgi:2-dehydro-3-deoxygluconokinase
MKETSRFDVTTLGEAMVRLSVPVGQRLELAAQLDMFPAGTEANLAVALARLGRRTAWVSALPDNPLGRLITNQLHMAGVDLSAVIWSTTGRIGTYFIEFSGPPRSTQVIYDRANSLASQIRPEQVDWDILLDTRLLHLTGITPALSDSCAETVREAVRRARGAGVAISFDVNYRSKLWSPPAAAQALRPLMAGVDLLLCGQEDAQLLFGCGSGSDDQGPADGKRRAAAREAIVRDLAEQSQAKQVVVTFGAEGAVAWDGSRFRHVAAVPVEIVDPIGAGDGLAAGIIHGWLDGDLAQGLRYGAVMAALALSQYGDMIMTTPAEVASLLESAEGGVVR